MNYYPSTVFRDPQVNLYVADIDASLRFYRDLFGFTETFRTPNQGTPMHIELRLGHLVLGLATIDSLRSVHGIEVGARPPHGEVVVWTDDVDLAFSHVTALGARPLNQPHDFIGTVRGAWVADPDGNPVQAIAIQNPASTRRTQPQHISSKNSNSGKALNRGTARQSYPKAEVHLLPGKQNPIPSSAPNE